MTSRQSVGLRIRDLAVTIGSTRLLSDVCFDVRPGEWLALIGPNGSGKSTLLRAITGLIGSSGEVRLDDGSRPDARTVALMAQTPVLPPGMSVAEYAVLGRTPYLSFLQRESDSDWALVARVLERLRLTDKADRPVLSLSGGEAQRASLARALVQQAGVLLLDEPTSALDLGAQGVVLDLVDDLRRSEGLTVVTALHDLASAAKYADRALLLADGRIRAHGSPDNVLTDELLHATYGPGVRLRYLDGEPVVLSAPRSSHASSSHASSSHASSRR